MKQVIVLILLLQATAVSVAQNVYFEDDNFKSYFLRGTIDVDQDGEISFEEALDIELIYIPNDNPKITSFTGLEQFKNIKKFQIYCEFDVFSLNFNTLLTK